MENDQKVSQCWEVSQWNLSTDDVGEGLKGEGLCVIYNNLSPNKMKQKCEL
mgnify:CR=1 FL=1